MKKKIKRFVVFAFDTYYPAGGVNDMRGTFKTLEKAQDFCRTSLSEWDYVEILDLKTGDVIDGSRRPGSQLIGIEVDRSEGLTIKAVRTDA